MMRADQPHRLTDNRVPVYYSGGERINRFRGINGSERTGPEDWVGSVSSLPAELGGKGSAPGVSVLPCGVSMRAAVTANPKGWLGPWAELPAGETGLLVKLLDAGERLPVHWHPSREFARAELASPFGKSEGWIVLEAEPGAKVWLGFDRDVAAAEVSEWVEAGLVEPWLAAMSERAVGAGDVLYVPAGVPHAIGPGILIVELQEPTSFSILAEYEPFGLGPEQATLGLGWKRALNALDRTGYADSERLTPAPRPLSARGDGSVEFLFPPEADRYFSAIQACAQGELAVPGVGLRIVVVTAGSGSLSAGSTNLAIKAGQTLVVPHAAGELTLSGELTAIVCKPGSEGDQL